MKTKTRQLTLNSPRRLLQDCQLPDKNSRNISKDIWTFLWLFQNL